MKNGMENSVFNFWSPLSHTSRCHCDYALVKKDEDPSKKKTRSDKDADEGHGGRNNTNVGDDISQYIGSGFCVPFMGRWYWFSKSDNTAQLTYHMFWTFTISYRRRFQKKRKRTAHWKPSKALALIHHLSFYTLLYNGRTYNACG